MRPPASTSSPGGFRWNSPIPYLFAGLAAMLGLIAFALLLLACSYRRSRNDEEKPVKPVTTVPNDTEPKIVVIMAGEDTPTFIAKPINPIQQTQDVLLPCLHLTIDEKPIKPHAPASYGAEPKMGPPVIASPQQ